MLAETLDTKLWDAQRVLQSASTHAVNLSGSDSLSRALDAAAGEAAAAPTGADSLLIDRIDAEYLRYFTGTGRPTKEWKAAIEAVTVAEQEVHRCAAAVQEVNDRVSRHEELSGAVQALESALAPAVQRRARAQQAHSALAEQREQLTRARQAAATAAAKSSNSALANGQRQQLAADGERRGQTLIGLQATLSEADGHESAAKEVAAAATTAAEQSAAALEAAQQRFDAAKAAAEACVAQEAADKLAARVNGIDEIETELDRIAEQSAELTLTAEALAGIERQWAAIQRAQAHLRADAPTVNFTAPVDLTITVDGDPRILAAGESWTQPASAAVVVEVPGVLSVRIDPGASAVKLHADLEAAQRLLGQELAAAGVPDVQAARVLDDRRRALTESRGTLLARFEGLCAGEQAAALRTQLAALRAAAAHAERTDPEAAIIELKAAEEALKASRTHADALQKAANAASAAHAATATEATVARDRLKNAETEFVTVREQLATLRAAVPDQDVAAQATADAEEHRRADAEVAALAEAYQAADPAAVEAELDTASRTVETVTAARDAAKLELHNLTVELAVIGSEGRQGQLDEAEAELERARAEHARVGERAQAAQLLRDTMIRHRDTTRKRYIQPYRTELERLGRQVFGASFQVDVDSELTIQTRTLDGCTVPYDSLSGGAKEQLGILARLAGAALVAEEDTVPVVIDDALGFTDPERLAKMGAVLNTVGDRGQVIVLTCTPGRYDSVADAEVIELSA